MTKSGWTDSGILTVSGTLGNYLLHRGENESDRDPLLDLFLTLGEIRLRASGDRRRSRGGGDLLFGNGEARGGEMRFRVRFTGEGDFCLQVSKKTVEQEQLEFTLIGICRAVVSVETLFVC